MNEHGVRDAFDRKSSSIAFSGPGRTKQSFKNECDINVIMAKYVKTGLLDHFQAHKGNYGDFIVAGDYQSHLNAILEADRMFMTLPADIRKKFDNDAAKFLAFAQDESNADAMVEMGLRQGALPDENFGLPGTPADKPAKAPERPVESDEA